MKEYNDLTQKLEQLSPISVGYIINLYKGTNYSVIVELQFLSFFHLEYHIRKNHCDSTFLTTKKTRNLEW